MKSIRDFLSPKSWLFQGVGVIVALLVLFRPTLWEFVYLHIIDFAALRLILAVDRKLFLRFFPKSEKFIDAEDFSFLVGLPPSLQALQIESLMEWPKQRALYALGMNFFKLTPAAICAIFLWDYEYSISTRILEVASYIGVIGGYFYSAVYLDQHEFVSRKLDDFHKVNSLGAAFSLVKLPVVKSHYFLPDFLGLISIGTFILFCNLVVIQKAYNDHFHIGAQVFAVSVVGLVLMMRLWFLSRSEFISRLSRIVTSIQKSKDKIQDVPALSLHSSPLLANFERTFNEMGSALKMRDRELAQWLKLEAEKSRYRALGEFSALIVHDLNTPLHVVQYCIEEAKDLNQDTQLNEFLDRMDANCGRALELTTSLRSYLRNPGPCDVIRSSLITASKKAHHLLQVQFKGTGFHQICFEFDFGSEDILVSMPPVDGVNVFHNLYKNCVENLLKNSVLNPKVVTQFQRNCRDKNKVEVTIRDNGTGLTSERFEELTGEDFLLTQKSQFRQGLGLRLIRQAVERNQGCMKILEETGYQGTIFSIELPEFQEPELRDASPKIGVESGVTNFDTMKGVQSDEIYTLDS